MSKRYSGKVVAHIPIERETADTADLLDQIEAWAENRMEAARELQNKVSGELIDFSDVHYVTTVH